MKHAHSAEILHFCNSLSTYWNFHFIISTNSKPCKTNKLRISLKSFWNCNMEQQSITGKQPTVLVQLATKLTNKRPSKSRNQWSEPQSCQCVTLIGETCRWNRYFIPQLLFHGWAPQEILLRHHMYRRFGLRPDKSNDRGERTTCDGNTLYQQSSQ
jgi:hypothetical protein